MWQNSLIVKPPIPIDSPGRSGSKFFCSYDKKLIIKAITSEEVALLHQILQQYHGVRQCGTYFFLAYVSGTFLFLL